MVLGGHLFVFKGFRMYYVYILEDIDNPNNHYIGYTSDLKRRFKEHNSKENQGYTRYKKWKLVYYEAYLDKDIAYKREQRIKRHSKIRAILYKRLGIK